MNISEELKARAERIERKESTADAVYKILAESNLSFWEVGIVLERVKEKVNRERDCTKFTIPTRTFDSQSLQQQ